MSEVQEQAQRYIDAQVDAGVQVSGRAVSHSGVVDPFFDLGWVETDEVTQLDVRDPLLIDEPAKVSDANA
jgi:hypothetical protein